MANHDMTRRQRLKGPLTERQNIILCRLANGDRQREIAKDMNLRESYLSAEVCLIVNKMDVRTSQAAVARYGSYLAYLKAADLLAEGKIRRPIDMAEEHVNHVLDDMAETIRRRAQKLLPQ